VKCVAIEGLVEEGRNKLSTCQEADKVIVRGLLGRDEETPAFAGYDARNALLLLRITQCAVKYGGTIARLKRMV
jgi:hypothetical protein